MVAARTSIRPRLGRVLVVIALAPVAIWAGVALAVFPHWPLAARIAAVAVFAGATIAGGLRWRGWIRVGSLAVPTAVVLALWQIVTPADDRLWAAGHERAPRVTFDGDAVVIEDLRHATWRTPADGDVRWETRRYDLRALRTVDLVVEPFHDWRGLAHIFVTFGFDDGAHVAISVESRRELGERYSPLRGMFRHYELLYVVGDERDLIGLRTNTRLHPVYLFPTRATPEEARALFVAMLRRADELARRPDFYHTATSTCATSLLRHVNEVRHHRVSALDWRVAFPGYADELAWELDLIAFDGTLEQARERFLINERSALDPALDGPAWSRRIRATGE